jgi:transglutaminase-like putative cysteine protease
MSTRRLVDAQGATLREESAMGMSATRMTREEATKVDSGDPPDLVMLAAIPNDGKVPKGPRVRMKISGVDPASIPDDVPLQVRTGDVVDISVPLEAELPHDLPIADTSVDEEVEPTISLPSTNVEIVERARAVVGDATNRLDAARRLYEFVHTYVQKVPTIGVPNGLEVLHSGRGDCNEHTALYVSLARAVGIPSRITAGVVYSSRMGDAFYYHAWPEVRLGPPDSEGRPRWVPIDPTLGQFPADGSHLEMAIGDLDRQIEIMGVMGRIRLEVLEVR